MHATSENFELSTQPVHSFAKSGSFKYQEENPAEPRLTESILIQERAEEQFLFNDSGSQQKGSSSLTQLRGFEISKDLSSLRESVRSSIRLTEGTDRLALTQSLVINEGDGLAKDVSRAILRSTKLHLVIQKFGCLC